MRIAHTLKLEFFVVSEFVEYAETIDGRRSNCVSVSVEHDAHGASCHSTQ